MLSFPSQNEKKLFLTDQVYSKQQTQLMANEHIFKSGLRLYPSSLNSFCYFFTFWFKVLSFKTHFKIEF